MHISRIIARIGLVVVAMAACCTTYASQSQALGVSPVRRIEWEKIKIDNGAYESAGVFDVNNDGKHDIVCGGYWYEAPNWTKHKVCDVMPADEYFQP